MAEKSQIGEFLRFVDRPPAAPRRPQRCWGMKDNVFTFDNFGFEGRGWIILVVKNGQIIGFQASPSALEKKITMSTH